MRRPLPLDGWVALEGRVARAALSRVSLPRGRRKKDEEPPAERAQDVRLRPMDETGVSMNEGELEARFACKALEAAELRECFVSTELALYVG